MKTAVLMTTLLFAFGAAASDDVTYTNSELTAMAEAAVEPNKTYEGKDVNGLATRTECVEGHSESQEGIDAFFEGAYVVKKLSDTEKMWMSFAYSTDSFKIARCYPYYYESESGRQKAYKREKMTYAYALPKWVAE